MIPTSILPLDDVLANRYATEREEWRKERAQLNRQLEAASHTIPLYAYTLIIPTSILPLDDLSHLPVQTDTPPSAKSGGRSGRN